MASTDRDLSLDLTAASTLHLLEPQWNPALEDQALARVHRLGQTRPVTTIRYVMQDSFEEVCILRAWRLAIRCCDKR
jgi:SNF2 family DNA or RNA helicase